MLEKPTSFVEEKFLSIGQGKVGRVLMGYCIVRYGS